MRALDVNDKHCAGLLDGIDPFSDAYSSPLPRRASPGAAANGNAPLHEGVDDEGDGLPTSRSCLDHDQGEEGAIETEEPSKPLGPIAAAWRPLDLTMLSEAPPARRWLLRHPTRDGQACAPGAGDGMLPLGKVGLLVADGGVGKTMALLGLGVSIITGRKWLGHFDIGHDARKGRVLLALAEEDAEEVHRRLYDLARAYNLTPEERARVAGRMVVLPLAGRSVSLLAYGQDGRTLVESPELVALRERLASDSGEDGWALVVLDPFARWAPDEAEKDNAIATRAVQAAETLLVVRGHPTVLFAHHASLDGVQTEKVRSRGATGIRNAARWEAYIREAQGEIFFKQSKSNYSRPMHDELRLVRGTGGLLRVPSEEQEHEHRERVAERQENKAAEKDARREARVLRIMEEMVEAVRAAKEPITARASIVGLVRGEKSAREDALARLLSSGRVKPVSVAEGKREKMYIVPPQVLSA